MQELRARKFMPLAKPIPGHGLDDALMVFMFKKMLDWCSWHKLKNSVMENLSIQKRTILRL